MRRRIDLETVGTLLVVLITLGTVAALVGVGSLKAASADLLAQVEVARDPTRAEARWAIGERLSQAFAADLAADNLSERTARARLLAQRSDRLLEATAVVALLGMLVGLVTARPASQGTRPRDASSTSLASTSSNGTV
jgi:hypothetical protein